MSGIITLKICSTDSPEIEAMQQPMLQKGFSQTSQGAKLAANNLFLAANSCKQIVYLLLKVFKRFSNYITKYMPNCLIWSDINVTTSCLKFLYCVQIEKCYMSSSLLQLSCLSFTPTHSFCLSPAPMAGTEHQTTTGLCKLDTWGGCSPHPLLIAQSFPEFLGYVLTVL